LVLSDANAVILPAAFVQHVGWSRRNIRRLFLKSRRTILAGTAAVTLSAAAAEGLGSNPALAVDTPKD
jgi:hypothetical protein